MYPSASDKALKKCWENIKARAKKTNARARRSAMATGGGPKDNFGQDEETLAVSSIILEQMQPLYNPFDNDNPSESESDSEIPR